MNYATIHPIRKPIVKEITIPGSKSYTNRALLLSALTKNQVLLKNALFSDDTLAMISCLQILGIKIETNDTTIFVKGSVADVKNETRKLNANLSGTTIRFLLALAIILPGKTILTGHESLQKRPISDLVEALRQIGAKIAYLTTKKYPPLLIEPSSLSSHKIVINGNISSQFISALLMIAPCAGGLTLHVTGEQISKPYIDMTIDSMEKFGVKVQNNNYQSYVVPKQEYEKNEYVIEGDYSSAGYFFAIAAITKSTITAHNLNPKSVQADRMFLSLLEQMGNTVTYGKESVTVKGNGITPLSITMETCPDQVQTLAVLSAFAKGKTTITGIRSLRVKETERVIALQNELQKMGIETQATEDAITIRGGNPVAARIATYDDHRMAMAFSVAATKLPGMQIEDPLVVNKTFPKFWKTLSSLGVKIDFKKSSNIVLIGMRGAGKTTLGKLLEKQLAKEFIETDVLITQHEDKSISDIVKEHGWDYFRQVEDDMIKKVSKKDNCIIATGGGAIIRPENVKTLKKHGKLFYLEAPVEVLVKRIGDDIVRPSLTGKISRLEDMREVLKQRKKLYEEAADAIIETKDKTANEVAEEIITILEDTYVY